MRIGGSETREVAAWFGGVAMLVQALLPLLVAAEIGLAAHHELPVAQPQAAIHDHRPLGGAHPHPAVHGCPFCLALASGQGFVLAAAPPAPLPAVFVLALAPVIAAPHLESFFSLTYRARAPPRT
jgi:DUF2946 family protein